MITDHGIWLSGAIALALLVASTVSAVLRQAVARGRADADIDNLRARVRSWWLMAGILGGVFWAGAAITTLFFVTLGLLALHEFMRTAPRPCTRDWIVGSGICIACVAFIPALLSLDIPGYAGRNLYLIVFLILVTQSSDVLQYVWGKLCGKHPIAPAISPAKTLEGFALGVASATAIGAGVWWITPFTREQAALVALLIALLGFCGGLVLSAQKRARGIKDWGTLIDGHGGILDRLDSVWLPAPLFFVLLKIGWGA